MHRPLHLLLLATSLLSIPATVDCNDDPEPLLMSLHTKQSRQRPPGLMTIEMCKNCNDPSVQGSHIDAFNAARGLQEYEIIGELIYAVPNDGIRKPYNADDLMGNIALFDRGSVPLVEKVLLAQAAGAKAVVLVDDGQCTDEMFTHCGMAGRLSDGGFAKNDRYELWNKVEIPAMFVTKTSGQRIKNLMHLELVSIPKLGDHWKNKS